MRKSLLNRVEAFGFVANPFDRYDVQPVAGEHRKQALFGKWETNFKCVVDYKDFRNVDCDLIFLLN